MTDEILMLAWPEDSGFDLDDWLFDWDYMPYDPEFDDPALYEAA